MHFNFKSGIRITLCASDPGFKVDNVMNNVIHLKSRISSLWDVYIYLFIHMYLYIYYIIYIYVFLQNVWLNIGIPNTMFFFKKKTAQSKSGWFEGTILGKTTSLSRSQSACWLSTHVGDDEVQNWWTIHSMGWNIYRKAKLVPSKYRWFRQPSLGKNAKAWSSSYEKKPCIDPPGGSSCYFSVPCGYTHG